MPNVFDQLTTESFKEALTKLPVNEKDAILVGIFGLAKLHRPGVIHTAEIVADSIQAVLGTALADKAGLGGPAR